MLNYTTAFILKNGYVCLDSLMSNHSQRKPQRNLTKLPGELRTMYVQ